MLKIFVYNFRKKFQTIDFLLNLKKRLKNIQFAFNLLFKKNVRIPATTTVIQWITW